MTLISATLVRVPYPHARICASCEKPISGPAIRICEKADGVISVFHYCPAYEEDLEQRACAPDTEAVRAVLPQRRFVGGVWRHAR